jgi:hypothetical protein
MQFVEGELRNVMESGSHVEGGKEALPSPLLNSEKFNA